MNPIPLTPHPKPSKSLEEWNRNMIHFQKDFWFNAVAEKYNRVIAEMKKKKKSKKY